MTKTALFMIELYQKYISPYKGFSCAHKIATGEIGCSGYGKKVISRYGIKTGYSLLQRRFAECKCSSEELKKDPAYKAKHIKKYFHPQMASQQGFCDLDCGGCDIPNCDLPSPKKMCSGTMNICDFFDICDLLDFV